MSWKSGIAMLAAAASLAGCDVSKMKMDPELPPLAQTAYARVVNNQADALFETMPTEFNTPQQRQMFSLLRQMIPAGEGKAVLAGWRAFANIDGSQQQLIIYRYDYAAGHITFTATFNRAKVEEGWKLVGFNMNPSAAEEVAAPSVGPPGSPPPVRTDAQQNAPAS